MKLDVTGQRAAGRGYGYVSCGGTGGNCGHNQSIGFDGEARRSSVEGDAGGSSESLAEEAEALASAACAAHEGDEGAEAHIQAKDRAAAGGVIAVVAGSFTAFESVSVKHSICGLDETGERVGSIGRVSNKAIER